MDTAFGSGGGGFPVTADVPEPPTRVRRVMSPTSYAAQADSTRPELYGSGGLLFPKLEVILPEITILAVAV